MTTLSLAHVTGEALIALKQRASEAHSATSLSSRSSRSARQIATAGYKQKEITMPDNWKQQANTHFRTLPGTEQRKTVISESEAGAAVVAANTARLKGLRLARDAAEQAGQPAAVAAKKAGGRKKPLLTSL
jgi:hypothetical protein